MAAELFSTQIQFMTQSIIEFTLVEGKSRVTKAQGIAPLKLLFPENSKRFGTVILSNYGGGYVQGDEISMLVDCTKNSCGYIGSQALTRIYKSDSGEPCVQTVKGSVQEDALMVFYPDLAVPQENSVFHQTQTWDIKKNALLVVYDGFSAGRISRDEVFDYSNYQSKLEVSREGVLVLKDNFNSDPAIFEPRSQGNFGSKYTVCANLFVVGTHDEAKYLTLTSSLDTSLDKFLRELSRKVPFHV